MIEGYGLFGSCHKLKRKPTLGTDRKLEIREVLLKYPGAKWAGALGDSFRG